MWQRIQSIAKVFAAIAVPAAVALVGWWIQSSLKQAEISAKMVELAISILQQEPGNAEEGTSALREYGIDLLEHYSAIPVTSTLRAELEQSPLPALRSQVSDGTVQSLTWGSQPWGSPVTDPESEE